MFEEENSPIIKINPEKIIITRTENGYILGAEYENKPNASYKISEDNHYHKEYVLPHIKFLEIVLQLFEIKEKQ